MIAFGPVKKSDFLNFALYFSELSGKSSFTRSGSEVMVREVLIS